MAPMAVGAKMCAGRYNVPKDCNLGAMMAGLLVRVGIDSDYGKWNAPCSEDGSFCYVPMGGGTPMEEYDPRYERYRRHVERYLDSFDDCHRRCHFPRKLPKLGHCDPDFRHLTYGDQGRRAARIRKELKEGDFIAFYAGLRSIETGELVYSLIGFYIIAQLTDGHALPKRLWHRNEHTRHGGCEAAGTSVVLADRGASGRLLNHIPIGSCRERAYRVLPNLLETWGGLDVNDGYIQRSAHLPRFERPARFLRWFNRQRATLVARDNPSL